ncbi:MAG: TPM domain-containing protein [Sphingobacteriales bacterium]
MSWFGLFKKSEDFFSEKEKEQIIAAIRQSEKRTSGEIRVFVESRCRFLNPLDRAKEIFFGLKMDKTDEHNAVLLYIAVKDRQLAVYGDEGIHRKVGEVFWKTEVEKMIALFKGQNYGDGLAGIVTEIGNALYQHFPYASDDKNELPDEIVFGK